VPSGTPTPVINAGDSFVALVIVDDHDTASSVATSWTVIAKTEQTRPEAALLRALLALGEDAATEAFVLIETAWLP